jgi:hypothetical protein
MTKDETLEIVCREYGLELLACCVEELSKIPGLERTGMIRPTYKFIINESNKKKTAALTGEDDVQRYNDMKVKAVPLLTKDKKQLKEILNITNNLALLRE